MIREQICSDCHGRGTMGNDLAYRDGKLVPSPRGPCRGCKGKGYLPLSHYLVKARLKDKREKIFKVS